MTPDQCREARTLLGWTQQRLAALVGLSGSVLSVYERTGRMQGALPGPVNNGRPAHETQPSQRLDAIRAALEAAGIVFTNGDKPGVTLRKADA